jgi:ATP-dependent protease ClpP protease subunit
MNTFHLIGEINYIKVKKFAEFLENLDGNYAVVNICSEGGIEAAGRALAGMIMQVRGAGCRVTTVAHGCVESAAVLVFAAGEHRCMSRTATCMVHESSLGIEGNSTSIRKAGKELEASEKFWCTHLATMTGTEESTWMKLHEKESQLYPDECLKLNLATKII